MIKDFYVNGAHAEINKKKMNRLGLNIELTLI